MNDDSLFFINVTNNLISVSKPKILKLLLDNYNDFDLELLIKQDDSFYVDVFSTLFDFLTKN